MRPINGPWRKSSRDAQPIHNAIARRAVFLYYLYRLLRFGASRKKYPLTAEGRALARPNQSPLKSASAAEAVFGRGSAALFYFANFPAIAFPTISVVAFPPTSSVRYSGVASTSSIALSIASAASPSPK
jgi:hypothetical protein